VFWRQYQDTRLSDVSLAKFQRKLLPSFAESGSSTSLGNVIELVQDYTAPYLTRHCHFLFLVGSHVCNYWIMGFEDCMSSWWSQNPVKDRARLLSIRIRRNDVACQQPLQGSGLTVTALMALLIIQLSDPLCSGDAPFSARIKQHVAVIPAGRTHSSFCSTVQWRRSLQRQDKAARSCYTCSDNTFRLHGRL
jgi:hypothetical protein